MRGNKETRAVFFEPWVAGASFFLPFAASLTRAECEVYAFLVEDRECTAGADRESEHKTAVSPAISFGYIPLENCGKGKGRGLWDQ